MKREIRNLLLVGVVFLIFKFCLSYISTKSVQPQKEIPLAVLEGDLEKVHNLIKDGADVNGDINGPLLSLTQGNVEITKFLLENGADPNLNPFTLHHYCESYKNPELVKLLIKYGAKVNYIDPKTGATPLHRAMYMFRSEVVKVLIENGADLSIKNKKGQTPIDVLKSKSDDKRKREVIEFLNSINIKI